ncbi:MULTISPECIES: cytochrome P450 [unclassified Streptomyces]|uniref:cytochrome P450 n=1 Tax=unclassified Streptomyces TaxID=2593676 RepID=UPI00343DA43D
MADAFAAVVRAEPEGRLLRPPYVPPTPHTIGKRHHVVRATALPDPVLDTLFGHGAVHTLDGEAHRIRKAMFLSLLKNAEGVAALAELIRARFLAAVTSRRRERLVLFDATADALALAVCEWAGLPLADTAVSDMARDCTAMVDGFASPGPRHVRSCRARARQERALAELVTDVRATRADAVTSGSTLGTVARHRDVDGNLLDPRVAAVELLNVIRPTIAIAWFATFAAHALHRWPHHLDLLRSGGGGGHAVAFADEVRRFHPFAPFVGGLAARDLEWRGEEIAQGTLVLLDLYGQNHDPALWTNPYRFDPNRFTGPHSPLDALVAQGGGDPARGHRCPGEDITVTALAVIATELARLDFDVPEQDLTIPLSRIPTLPRSGFELILRP